MPRGLVILLGAAATVVVVWGVREISWLAGPTALALMIVIAASPLQGWLRRHGVPRWAAVVTLLVLIYLGLIAFVLVVVVSVARLGTLLPSYAHEAQQLGNSITQALSRFGVTAAQVRSAASSLDFGKIVGSIGSLLSGLTGVAGNLVFLVALLFFLGAEAAGIDSRLGLIAEEHPDAAAALRDFARGTRRFLVVTTVFGFIVAVLDTIALALLGIPLAILWGVLAFVTNYIPNLGFILGLLPPALLGLLEGGWRLAIIVIVVYSLLNFVVQSLIQPRFVGNSVGLSPTVTFVALVFWAWVLGPLGALLAVPLTLLAKAVLVDIDPRARWADALVRSGNGFVPGPAAPAPDAPSPAVTADRSGGDRTDRASTAESSPHDVAPGNAATENTAPEDAAVPDSISIDSAPAGGTSPATGEPTAGTSTDAEAGNT